MVKTVPTVGYNVETIDAMDGLSLFVWHVGGQSKLKTLWKQYYADTSGINPNQVGRFFRPKI